jgi:hypothetical protein
MLSVIWRFAVRIGDEVVIMSAPGRFAIVAMNGPVLTLENREGIRKTVHITNVRTIGKPEPAATES